LVFVLKGYSTPEKKVKLDIGLTLLSGLDEERDASWIAGMKREYNECITEGVISYPHCPLVKNKRVRIEVNPYQSSIFVAFERRVGNGAVGIKLTLAEYQLLRKKFENLKTFITANETHPSGAVQVIDSMGLKENKDFEGWKYARMDMGANKYKVTLKWHEDKCQTVIKIHRGRLTEGGYWVPDKENEISLSAGAMIYLMNHLDEMIERHLEAWEIIIKNDMLDCSTFLIEDEPLVSDDDDVEE
jgi:hypothetical protein